MPDEVEPGSRFHDDVENGDGDVVVVPDQFECFPPGMRMQEAERATVDADVPHREDSRVERRIVVDDQDVPGFSAREFLVPMPCARSSKMQAVVRRVAGHCGRGGCRGLCRRRCREHCCCRGILITNVVPRQRGFHRNSPAEDAGHDVVNDVQPQPAAALAELGGEEGSKMRRTVLRECVAVIADREANPRPLRLAGAQDDVAGAASVEGVQDGVVDEIGDDLAERP